MGGVITAIQVVYGLFTGSAICPNAGCKVVEGLTLISPFFINVLGFVFFLSVLWGGRLRESKPAGPVDVLAVVLTTGLVFDSILLAYQVFVARTFCGYCLLIFGLVLVLNILYGLRQTIIGAAVMGVTFFSFSILTFLPAGIYSQAEPLKSAAYGLKSCSAPTKEVYLVFSSNCPYCENVLQALSTCNSCDLYLNPIDAIGSLDKFPANMAIDLNPNFSPEINRLAIGVLGIDTVPVLIVKSPEGYRLIKGEKKIVNYIQHACFTKADVMYYDPSSQSTSSGGGMTFLSDEDGECSVAIDCEPK